MLFPVKLQVSPCCFIRWTGDIGLTLVATFLGDPHPSPNFSSRALLICAEDAPLRQSLPTRGVISFTGEPKSSARTLPGLAITTFDGVRWQLLCGDWRGRTATFSLGFGEFTDTSFLGERGILFGDNKSGLMGDLRGLSEGCGKCAPPRTCLEGEHSRFSASWPATAVNTSVFGG